MSKTSKTNEITISTHNCVKLGIKVELILKNISQKTIETVTNNKYNDIFVIEKSNMSAILKNTKLTTSNFSIGEKNIIYVFI